MGNRVSPALEDEKKLEEEERSEVWRKGDERKKKWRGLIYYSSWENVMILMMVMIMMDYDDDNLPESIWCSRGIY